MSKLKFRHPCLWQTGARMNMMVRETSVSRYIYMGGKL